MRRVVPILLVLVLVPSSVAASWYTCRYDNVTRSACCCPARDDQAKPRPPAQEARLREACCCTVTQAAGAPAMERTSSSSAPLALDLPAVTLAVARPVPVSSARAGVALARPRALDPPDTLFSRRCSLLL